MASSAELAPQAMRPKPCVIGGRRSETPDTFTLRLAPGADGAGFRPGQFNMLYAFGVGEVPISISGDPSEPGQWVHTVRAVGSVTRAIQKLGTGAALGVRGPFGSEWPMAAAEGHDLVIVAGGIGLAPLRPALYHALRHRNLYGRVVLLYGARTPGDLLFKRELREWRSRFDVEARVTVDHADADWQGAVGVVTKQIGLAQFDPGHCAVFVCGPEVMMRFSVMALEKRGVPESAIWVSMERNMECGLGLCGHCQFGPYFVCKDGPVFRYDAVLPFFRIREV